MTVDNNIKSVYDPKLVKQKRLDSAKKLFIEFTEKNQKDLVYVDKSKSFFGVKNSDKKHIGYYTIQELREDKNKNKIYGCNCYDYVKILEINPDHECKHILFIKLLIKNKTKVEIKDLKNLVVDKLE